MVVELEEKLYKEWSEIPVIPYEISNELYMREICKRQGMKEALKRLWADRHVAMQHYKKTKGDQ